MYRLTLLLTFSLTLHSPAFAVDHDKDGLTDDFEQALLVKFEPTFMLSADECDGKPAEFMPGSNIPEVIAKNGTIYGQVFQTGKFLEIHYYHLWSRDCGRLKHALDVEHVSALVEADGLKARYWYAAAHENTLCNASTGASATLLEAEEDGPVIWVSEGKHGSFLSSNKCRLGCGGDRCHASKVLRPAKLINIGEHGAPMNGAVWIDSDRWSLPTKLRSDFPPAVMAQLQAHPTQIVSLNVPTPPTKAIILGGNSGLGAFILGQRTGIQSLGKSALATHRWLNKFFKTE